MTARVRWALVKACWLMAGVTFFAAAYMNTGPRFY